MPDVQWEKAAYMLMAKFSWNMDDIKQLSLSTFTELHKLVKWEYEEQERRRK